MSNNDAREKTRPRFGRVALACTRKVRLNTGNCNPTQALYMPIIRLSPIFTSAIESLIKSWLPASNVFLIAAALASLLLRTLNLSPHVSIAHHGCETTKHCLHYGR